MQWRVTSLPDSSRHVTCRGHTHTPHAALAAALAGSTPASSQAGTWVQGHSFQGHMFSLSNGTSSPEQSWGRPGVCLPRLHSSRAAGCCGPRLSSAPSACASQTGRLRTPTSPLPSQQSLPLRWSPWSLCGLRPAARGPLTNGARRAALLSRADPPICRGSTLALQSASLAGPG